jgi:hypothetical protein
MQQETPGTLEAIAARLRQTIDAADSAAKQEGETLGHTWACESATYHELEEVAELQAREWSYWYLPASHTIVQFLEARTDFFDYASDEYRIEPNAFFLGFLEGAANVWDEVAPLVSSPCRS